MTTSPLFSFDAKIMPSLAGKLRLAMIAGALFVAAMAFIFPLLTGDKDPLISAVFLGVAVLDLGMAVFLPTLLARSPALTRFALYDGRIEIQQGSPAAPRTLAALDYAKIAAVDDAADILSDKDRAAGFTAVRLQLRAHEPALATMPYYDRQAQCLTLRGLRSDENPFARIKDMVEKSKAS